MTGEATVQVVQCPTCGVEHTRQFSEAQLRELVDEDARSSGGNLKLSSKIGFDEKTIRRLRNGIAVSADTLLKLDLHYQQRPDLLARLHRRYEYDRKREPGPRLFLTMPGASAATIRRRER